MYARVCAPPLHPCSAHFFVYLLPQVSPASAVAMESQISPLVLELWITHVNDPWCVLYVCMCVYVCVCGSIDFSWVLSPFALPAAHTCRLSSDALGVIEALVSLPECQIALLTRLVSPLKEIIDGVSPYVQMPTAAGNLVEASLEMLVMLLRRAPGHVRDLHAALFPSLIALGQREDDASCLQSLCNVLQRMLEAAGTDFGSWSLGDGSSPVPAVLAVVEKTLQPQVRTYESFFFFFFSFFC